MKRIIISLIFIIAAISSFSQSWNINQSFGSQRSRTQIKGVGAVTYGIQILTSFDDTTSANDLNLNNLPGLVILVGDTNYLRSQDGTRWIMIGTGAGDGGILSLGTSPFGLSIVNDSTYQADTSQLATLYALNDTAAAIRGDFWPLSGTASMTSSVTINGRPYAVNLNVDTLTFGDSVKFYHGSVTQFVMRGYGSKTPIIMGAPNSDGVHLYGNYGSSNLRIQDSTGHLLLNGISSGASSVFQLRTSNFNSKLRNILVSTISAYPMGMFGYGRNYGFQAYGDSLTLTLPDSSSSSSADWVLVGTALPSNEWKLRWRKQSDIAGGGTTYTIGTFDTETPSSDGAVINGSNEIVFQPASTSVPGMMTSAMYDQLDSLYQGLVQDSVSFHLNTGPGSYDSAYMLLYRFPDYATVDSVYMFLVPQSGASGDYWALTGTSTLTGETTIDADGNNLFFINGQDIDWISAYGRIGFAVRTDGQYYFGRDSVVFKTDSVYLEDASLAGASAGYVRTLVDPTTGSSYWAAPSGSSAVWGAITGTITDQTDLTDRYDPAYDSMYLVSSTEVAFVHIDGTEDTLSFTGGETYVDSIYRKAGQDSIFYQKNGTEYAILDSTGGGAASFIDLDDVPSSYSGQASKTVKVNAAANALEFVDSYSASEKGYQAMGSSLKAEALSTSIGTANQSVALTDGQRRVQPVYLSQAATLTGVKFYMRTQGNFTADNVNRVVLYTESSGTLTEVATSANDGDIWKVAAGSLSSVPFTSTYAAAAGLYYVGFIYNNSAQTTAPALAAITNLAGSTTGMSDLDFANNNKLSGFQSSQSDLTSPYTLSSASTSAQVFWFMLY